jgi:hypothetical protein
MTLRAAPVGTPAAVAADRAPRVLGLPFRFAVLLVALLGAAWSVKSGWDVVVLQQALPSPDSYTRLLRLLGSIDAGQVLHHVPRDNGGAVVPLHWTHLLDALILLLALPLLPFMSMPEALRWAGAAVGPLTAAAAGIAAVHALRAVSGRADGAVVAGVLAVLATNVFCYAAFGRADHHVLMGTLAMLTVTLAYVSAERGRSAAAIGGAAAALGVWTSPEAMPFALLGWAFAILADARRDGRVAARATAFALAYLAVLAAALLLDPPPAGMLHVEMDRLSRPFVEQAALMAVGAIVGARVVPAAPAGWPAALWGAAVAGAVLAPWVALYPDLLNGAQGVFSDEGWRRIWHDNAEIKSSFSSVGYFAFFLAQPLIVLAIAMVALVRHRRDPVAVLAVIGTLFLLYIGARHIRLAIYPQLAAAIAAGILLARWTAAMPSARRRLVMALATLPLAVGPMIGLAAFSGTVQSIAVKDCTPRAVARELVPFTDKVVLSPYMDSAELLWFAPVRAVAGPYHRAERHILDSLDAYEARDFRDRMPDSFSRTGATAVLVCPSQPQAHGSLGEALAAGQAPAWLVEIPISPASGYRLYSVR